MWEQGSNSGPMCQPEQSAMCWLWEALGNYFGNTTEIISLTNTNGKRQTVQSAVENNTEQERDWMSSVMTSLMVHLLSFEHS